VLPNTSPASAAKATWSASVSRYIT